MNELLIIAGFSSKWKTHLKKVQLAKAGLKTVGHHVFEPDCFEDIRTVKSTINTIINKVLHEELGSSIIYTNSDTAIQWVNNAILLSKTPKENLAESINLTPINEEQVKLFVFDEESELLTQIPFETYGYNVPFITVALKDLFSSSLSIQEYIDSED